MDIAYTTVNTVYYIYKYLPNIIIDVGFLVDWRRVVAFVVECRRVFEAGDFADVAIVVVGSVSKFNFSIVVTRGAFA